MGSTWGEGWGSGLDHGRFYPTALPAPDWSDTLPRGGHRGQRPRKAPALGSEAAATVSRAGRGGPLPGPGTRGRPESRVAFYAHRFGVPSLLVALVASGLQPAAFPPPKRAARAVATRGEALRRGPLETAGPPGRKPQSPPLGPVWATGEDAEGRRGDRQLARQGRQTADRGEQGEGLQDATASGPRGGGRPPATGVQRPEPRWEGRRQLPSLPRRFPQREAPVCRGARAPRTRTPWGGGEAIADPQGRFPELPRKENAWENQGRRELSILRQKPTTRFLTRQQTAEQNETQMPVPSPHLLRGPRTLCLWAQWTSCG